MDHLSTQNPSKAKEVRTHSGYSFRPLILVLIGMVVFLVHCTKPMSHRREMVANRPETKVFKMKPDVVREAVKRALENKKFIMASEQGNELHLQTEWLEDQGYRSKVVADIKPLSRSKTELSIMMHLEKKLVFLDKWKPMDEIPEDAYRILMGDIEMECYRVLYDRT
ncbi:MAG: hypothetical protein JSU80_13290 [Deltaproteobacteria bacterium]|nr:MAG: hypothetical protein JSU80_13290 [Deltaproteobacteria bacterium]